MEGPTSPAAEDSGPLHPLKGQRFHTFHRLTQNEVFAALPPTTTHSKHPAGFPEIMPTPGLGSLPIAPTYLRPTSQGYLKSKRAHSAPGMPCAVARMALIMSFQSLEVHLVPSLLCLLRISPNSNRNFADALALQLTICAK